MQDFKKDTATHYHAHENNIKTSNKKEHLRKTRLQRQNKVEIMDDDDVVDLSESIDDNVRMDYLIRKCYKFKINFFFFRKYQHL